MNDFIPAFCAFMIGLGISALNYCISRNGLKKNTNGNVLLTSVSRQFLSVGYLVVLYFAADLIGCSTTYILLGGALGLTLPLLYFSVKLIRQLENEKPPENGKKENGVNIDETDKTDEINENGKKGE